MLLLSNFIYICNETPIILAHYSVDINKMILMFKWRGKRARIAKPKFNEKNKVGGPTLPNFKTYYKAIAIKIVWYL